MFRSMLSVSLLAALGSALSFLLQFVLARLFGTGPEMDAYLLAVSVPSLVGGLVSGALDYQLVPLLQHAATRPAGSPPVVQALVRGLGSGALALALVGIAATSPVLRALNPSLAPAQTELATVTARIVWLCLPLTVLSAIYAAALQVRQRFATAAALRLGPVTASLLLCLLGARQLGISAIAWGQLAGTLVMAVAMRVAGGPGLTVASDWRSLRRLILEFPLAFAGLVIFVIYPLSDAFWGSRIGPSAVSYLGYVQRLLVGLGGLAVVGGATVIFPQLAEQSAQGDDAGLRASVARSLRTMLVCIVPTAALLSVLAMPVLQILFQRGAFRLADASALAGLLPYMLAGIAPMTCMTLLFKALFARGQVHAAALVSGLGSLGYFMLSGLLSHVLGLQGFGVAYALIWWCALLAGLYFSWRGESWRPLLTANISFISRLVLNTALVAVVAWLGSRSLPPAASTDNLTRFWVTGATSALAGVVYLALGNTLMGTVELRLMRQRLIALALRA